MASTRFSVAAVFSAVDRVTAPVSRMQNSVMRFSRSAERGLKSVDRALGKVTGALNTAAKTSLKFAAAGVGALGAAALYTLNAFSKIENAEAYFTPLLGGAARAKEMVAELNKAAAATPFEFTDLADAAGQLLPVMNGDIQRTIKTMQMLGDTAGGNAQKLDSVTRGFTKAMLKGKVDMESLNMIAEAGVPIFEDLAAVMGMKTGEKFFKMISAGKVSTKALEQAFVRLTGEGGKFYKGMEIASLTLSGKWSTLKDNINLTAAAIGEQLAPDIKALMDRVIALTGSVQAWVGQNKELLRARFIEFLQRARVVITDLWNKIVEYNRTHDILGTVVSLLTTIGRVIMFLGEHGKKIAIIVGAIYGIAAAVKIATGAMAAFNFVVGLNPFVLLAGLIVGASLAFAGLVTELDFVNNLMNKIIDKIPSLGKLGDMAFNLFGDDDPAAGQRAKNDAAHANRPKRQRVSQAQQTSTYLEKTERSTVDVNFNNAPKGTDIVNRSPVPGLRLNMGYSG